MSHHRCISRTTADDLSARYGTGSCGRPGKCPAPIILALAVIMLTLSAGVEYGFAAHEMGIVVAGNLNLRPQPGTSKPPLAKLKKGTRVTILSHQSGWLKVRHSNLVGYIQNRKAYVRIISVDQETESGEKLQQYKQEAEEIHREIEKTEKKVKRYTSKEVDILTNLDDLDYFIGRAGLRISANRAELKALDEKTAATRASSPAAWTRRATCSTVSRGRPAISCAAGRARRSTTSD